MSKRRINCWRVELEEVEEKRKGKWRDLKKKGERRNEIKEEGWGESKGKKPVSRFSLAQRKQRQKPWASSRRARRANEGSTRLTADL